MTFIARPEGTTLRRRIHESLYTPHPGHERFDPEFPVAMRCNRCGKHAFGPRKYLREAMQEHWETSCEARHTMADAPKEARIFYPRAT